jgi:hypothetical protein
MMGRIRWFAAMHSSIRGSITVEISLGIREGSKRVEHQ